MDNNNAKVILDTDIVDVNITQIPISNGKITLFSDKFPYRVSYEKRDKYGKVTSREIMLCTAKNGNNLVVTRKFEYCPLSDDSTEQTKTSVSLEKGGIIEARITSGWMSDRLNEIKRLESAEIGLDNSLLYVFSNISDYSKPQGWSGFIKVDGSVNTPPGITGDYFYYQIIAKSNSGGGYGAIAKEYKGGEKFFTAHTQSNEALNWIEVATTKEVVHLNGDEIINGNKTFNGNLSLNNNYITKSKIWFDLYDSGCRPGVIMPALGDYAYFGTKRGFNVLFNRTPINGSADALFTLNNTQTKWASVSASNPVVIEIEFPGTPYISRIDIIHSGGDAEINDYKIEYYNDSDNNGSYIRGTIADTTGNTDYIVSHSTDIWRVKKVKITVTSSGAGGLPGQLNIGTIQLISPVHGRALGGISTLGYNEYLDRQKLASYIEPTSDTELIPRLYLDNRLDGKSIKVLTQAEYDALGTKDANTLYFTT